MTQPAGVFAQPKPFYFIFSLEFWERFGFYGIQCILPYYFVEQLGYSEYQTDFLYSGYLALVFGLVALGGKLGDTVIGTKRAVLLGSIVLSIAYFAIGMSVYYQNLFFWGLGAIAIGNGLFKANPSHLLAKCYKHDDPRIDGAFTMYYMAINLGSMFSMLLVPFLSRYYGWGISFFVCTFGLIICTSIYIIFRHIISDIGSDPDKEVMGLTKWLCTLLGIIISIAGCAWLIVHANIERIILCVISGIALLWYVCEITKNEGIARIKMIVALILLLEGFIFYIPYFQLPTSLNFFILHNVKHEIFGIPVAPAAFQSFNPIFIVILSPMLAFAYGYLGLKKRDLTMPFKFVIGMILTALGFLILSFSTKFANSNGIISSGWILLSFGVLALGELMISGLGLAMIAKLVPAKLKGFMMGVWFLNSALASIVAGFAATYTAQPSKIDINHVQSVAIYGDFFFKVGLTLTAIAFIMLLIAPKLSKILRKS